MENQDFVVVEDKTLGNGYEPRYVVINPETGEVLDDAQGYGFKTRQAAYKCYGFKLNHENPKQYKKDMKKIIKDFIEANKDAFNEVYRSLEYATRDNEKVTNKMIIQLLKQYNIELPFTINDLKRFW